jgi:hypothetical protein
MNPELQRNLWLEATPTRLLLMAGFWGLVTFAILATASQAPIDDVAAYAVAIAGAVGYGLIVILWGTRNAARAVIGEVRERTWDFQRLSAIRPWSMTVGKLFGATSYIWFGGAITLAMTAPGLLKWKPGGEGLALLGLMLACGVLGHAAAMGSGLFAARRRKADARVSIFPHQLVGLIAAALPMITHSAAGAGDRINALLEVDVPTITWYGLSFAQETFVFLIATAFAAWAVVGCWRLMRLELMATNLPFVWPAFLVFLTVFLAGYAGVFVPGLAIAYAGLHVAALAAVLLEPKNHVDLRAFGSAVAGGRLGEALKRAPAYAWAFAFAAAAAIVVATQGKIRVGVTNIPPEIWIAWLGFLARDIGVFLFYHANPRQNRGDFAAIITLVVLYSVMGPLADASNVKLLEALFRPESATSALTAALPWLEAAGIFAFALSRSRAVGRRASPPAAAAAPA